MFDETGQMLNRLPGFLIVSSVVQCFPASPSLLQMPTCLVNLSRTERHIHAARPHLDAMGDIRGECASCPKVELRSLTLPDSCLRPRADARRHVIHTLTITQQAGSS